MARIRTIKPEFFTSEDIVSLSPLARLLYVALWCEADKEGRLVWKPMTFKLRYLPGDNIDIKEHCDELVSAGVVKLYGDGLAYIPQFTRHQHVNPRESSSVLPAPPDYTPETPKKITADVRNEVMDRDSHKCVRCNSTEDLTLDHILPQSLGGPHIAENLRCMCRKCNSARPVSGQGLVDDLEIDGFSIEMLRSKFGIDASARVSTRANPKQHAQGGREGKGREGDSVEPPRDSTPIVVSIPLVDGSDHQIHESALPEWKSAYPGVDVVQQLHSMRSWCIANPTKRKTTRGVGAFVVRWLAAAQDKAGTNGRAVAPANGAIGVFV